MKMLRKNGASLLPGMIAAGLLLLAAPARSVELNPEMLKTVDEMVRKMQQETMQQQYAAMPVKNELPNRMMNSIYNNMFQYGQNAYRPVLQPQMVQAVIGQMRPWNFPNQFQQQMMPQIVAQVSGQIKGIQLQQMQQGIMDASFPAAQLPMGQQNGAGQGK